jgi:NADH-quinone oxidoreductase subunit L
MINILPFLIILPCICASFFVWFFLNNLNGKQASIVTTVGVTITFIASCCNFYQTTIMGQIFDYKFFDWIHLGSFQSSWSFYSDGLTSVMLVVVTLVSTLVHVYSIGYMVHDNHRQRFMAYLCLFTFFMIILVSSADFLQLFVGWEGVGLSSYLLIGFWFKKDSANSAAIKAFITNRVGDFALIIGIAAIYCIFGTLNFREIFDSLHIFIHKEIVLFGLHFHYLSFVALMLFIGCMGKSAQLGLHVWLPDAMEGPTPVSALIHAATMVTAGVFLIVRCSALFDCAPLVKDFIVLVGALTAIFAATIALTQNDIKKIIAYSTCSQLGYMFFACGVGAYTSAMFHLVTHAFFKALLFLSAGSVIHAVNNQQDITKMGGLCKKIPFTFSCFMIGSIAIAGIFPLAGFFSKDAILEAAYTSNSQFASLAFILGVIAACCTTIYSWRLITLTFHGAFKGSKDDESHIHESPLSMTIPLGILCLFSVISGYILEYFFLINHKTSLFWIGLFNDATHGEGVNHHISQVIKYMPMALSLLIIIISYFVFLKTKIPSLIARMFYPFYKIFACKYFIDEIYKASFVKLSFYLATLSSIVDKKIVDTCLVSTWLIASSGFAKIAKTIQDGKINHYILSSFVFIGIVFFTCFA